MDPPSEMLAITSMGEKQPSVSTSIIAKSLNPQSSDFIPINKTTITPPILDPVSSTFTSLNNMPLFPFPPLPQQTFATSYEMNSMAYYGHCPLGQEYPPLRIPAVEHDAYPLPVASYERNGTVYFENPQATSTKVSSSHTMLSIPSQRSKSVPIPIIKDSDLPTGVSSFVKKGQTYFTYATSSSEGCQEEGSVNTKACDAEMLDAPSPSNIDFEKHEEEEYADPEADQQQSSHEEYYRQQDHINQWLDVHHINWLGCPMLNRTFTPADVSLVVIMTQPKKDATLSTLSDLSLLNWTLLRNAIVLIDPVAYFGPLDVLHTLKGTKLQEAVTGSVRQYYSAFGTWSRDYSYNRAVEETPLHDPMSIASYLETDGIFNGWFRNNDLPTRSLYHEVSESTYEAAKAAKNEVASDKRKNPVGKSPLSKVAFSIFEAGKESTIQKEELSNSSPERSLIPTPLTIHKVTITKAMRPSQTFVRSTEATVVVCPSEPRSDIEIDEEDADTYGSSAQTSVTSTAKTSPTMETFEAALTTYKPLEQSCHDSDELGLSVSEEDDIFYRSKPEIAVEDESVISSESAELELPSPLSKLTLSEKKADLAVEDESLMSSISAEFLSPISLLDLTQKTDLALEDESMVSSDSTDLFLPASLKHLTLSVKHDPIIHDVSTVSPWSAESCSPISLSWLSLSKQLDFEQKPMLAPRNVVDSFNHNSPERSPETFFAPHSRPRRVIRFSQRSLLSSPSQQDDDDKVPVRRPISQTPWAAAGTPEISTKRTFASGFPEWNTTPIGCALSPKVRATSSSAVLSSPGANPFGGLRDIPQQASNKPPVLKRVSVKQSMRLAPTSRLPKLLPPLSLREEAESQDEDSSSDSNAESVVHSELFDGLDEEDTLTQIGTHFSSTSFYKPLEPNMDKIPIRKALTRSKFARDLPRLAQVKDCALLSIPALVPAISAFKGPDGIAPNLKREQKRVSFADAAELTEYEVQTPRVPSWVFDFSKMDSPSSDSNYVDSPQGGNSPAVEFIHGVGEVSASPSRRAFLTKLMTTVNAQRPENALDANVETGSEMEGKQDVNDKQQLNLEQEMLGAEQDVCADLEVEHEQEFEAEQKEGVEAEMEVEFEMKLEVETEQDTKTENPSSPIEEVMVLLTNFEPQVPALNIRDATRSNSLEPRSPLPTFKRTRPSFGQKVWSKITGRLHKKQPMAPLVTTKSTSRPKNKALGSVRKFFTQEINVLA